MKNIPDIIKIVSRELRKNMTNSEKLLWEKLKSGKIGKKFYRQKPIFVFKEDSGLDRYIIADFYSPENKMVIELDGSIHNIKEIYNLDLEKEKLLLKRGIKVIRFKNQEIDNDLDLVIEKILKTF